MKVDIIGDIHGCLEELLELMEVLGYKNKGAQWYHPDKRQIVFLGDLTDRGPSSIEVIHLVYQLVTKDKIAKYIPGNHCDKLYRYFQGNNVKILHGLETTVEEYQALDKKEQASVRNKMIRLYEHAPLYLELPKVHAVIAHAGIKESLIGRHDKRVKSFVLYGDTTGETLPDGRPVRRDWAQHYTGNRWIVYGHTPVMEPRFVNKTVNIDTGAVFGNKLTAFRLPEEQIVDIPSKQPFMEEKFSYFRA